jgi:hypothetical protein
MRCPVYHVPEQLYRKQSLHPPGHLVTTAVLRQLTNQRSN